MDKYDSFNMVRLLWKAQEQAQHIGVFTAPLM
jgi:hypothetical protein